MAGGIRSVQREPVIAAYGASYIRNQEEHHRKRSFEEEFRVLLEKSGVTYDREELFAA
jgi:hypothetical protein